MWRFVLICVFCWTCDASVTCKNDSNVEVDWYIIYKAPRQRTGLTGLGYLYIDSDGAQEFKRIDRASGALANTLRPMLKSVRSMQRTFGFISYNDQPPGCSADTKKFGHSKGVLMVDSTSTGVWLLHSTPQFPFRRDQNNFWPPSGFQHGQIFFCVTFNYDQFRHIGEHLQHIRAFPFDHDIPDNFHQELKDAVKWNVKTPPTQNFPTLTSHRGHTLKTISKQTSFELTVGDLYFTVAKELHSNVYVQTWGCQRDESHIDAGKSVINIKIIKTNQGEWKPPADHSKWCVTVDQNRPWTCVSDVNRGMKQYERYGGALCIQDQHLHDIFKGFAKRTDTSKAHDTYPECDSDSDSFSMLDLHTVLLTDYDSDFMNGTSTDADAGLLG